MREKIKKRIFPTLLISSLVPLIIFLSTTFDVFAANYNELVFSLSDFYFISIGLFFAVFIALFFALLFLPRIAYRVVAALLLAFSFMTFLQSVLLNGDLSTLGGDGEGKSISKTTKVINICIWVVIHVAFVTISVIRDKKGIVSNIAIIIAVAIFATNIVTPVSSAISHPAMFSSFEERQKNADDEYKHMLLTNKNLTTAMSDGNIFLFCIDKFDENWLEYVYENKPEAFDTLNDFTWFQDHISRYGHTYPSIANMITETPYVTEEDPSRVAFLNRSYDNAPSLKILHDEGWRINIFSEKFYSYNDASYLPDWVENKAEADVAKVTNSFKLSCDIVKLGLYRTLPFVLKDFMKGVSTETFSDAIKEWDKDGHEEYRPKNGVVNKWTNTEFSLLEGKGFYFIHIQGMHNAYETEKIIPLFEESLNIINRYITFLKQNGLYDNATIIITGDHGNGTPYNKTELKDSVRTGMFIKPAGVSHEQIAISSAQTSHTQLWTTILELAGAENGKDYGMSILETPEGVDQERLFTWHTYNCDIIEFQYIVRGSAKDFSHWECTSTRKFSWRITD